MSTTPIKRPVSVTRRNCLAGGAAMLALAACSSPPVPRSLFYRLGAGGAPAPITGGPRRGTVEVPPFRAAGVVNESAILFRDGPRQIEQYSYHSWAEPPTVMTQRAVVDALRQANVFDIVTTPEMRMDRDYELLGDLRHLEHVRGGGAGSAAIEIEFSLRRVGGSQQLLLKTYQANEPASGDSVDAAVEAFRRGLDSIIANLVTDLAALPRG
jgi:ABC-type uncharacterized transport system auxiliary subunit